MLRYLRVSGASSGESKVAYYANKPRFITSNKVFVENLNPAFNPPSFKIPLVFNDSIVLSVPASTTAENRYYEAIINVSDNQPIEESVKEITEFGVSISVYNEHGVKICDNSVTPSGKQSSTETSGPGEMTSEPIDEPGAMI